MKTKIKWLVGLGLAGVALYILGSYRRTPERTSPEKYKQILDEVCRADLWVRNLTPNASESLMAYLTETDSGRRVVLLDLKTLEYRLLPITNEVRQIFDWSPDDRYLAFVEELPPSPRQVNKSIISLYDRQTDSIRRLTQDTNVEELSLFWLPNNSYLFGSRKLEDNGKEDLFLGNPKYATKEKVCGYEPDLVVMSDKMATFARDNELFTLEIKPLEDKGNAGKEAVPAIQQISAFASNGFNGLRWLRYCPETGSFSFRTRPAGSNWFYSFQYNAANKTLTQSSHEDTYNGQWLQRGTGFAYVVNTNDGFELAVRTKEAAGNTNLFTDGNLMTYRTTPNGNRIYVAASLGPEPLGIWEYNLTNRTLRKLVNMVSNGFAAAQIVPSQGFKVKSSDGLEVPCLLYPPVNLANEKTATKTDFLSRLRPKTKYPAVIYVPVTSNQYQRGYDYRSHGFANMGFYFATINYRGCDGYGAYYSSLADTAGAAQDVMALYKELIKNPNIDGNNIFLTTCSGGGVVVFELLAAKPHLWRAVALDKLGGCPGHGQLVPDKLPPLLMIMGDQDPGLKSMQEFVSWATEQKVRIKSITHVNTPHNSFSINELEQSQKEITDFFLENLH